MKTKAIGMRLLLVVLIGACLALVVGCSGNGDRSAFEGTWDLQYGHDPNGSEALTAESVASMRNLGLDAYLVLDESGSLALVTFDAVKHGDWKITGSGTANATVEGQSANIVIQGDDLHLIQQDTTLVFSRGDPKDARPEESAGASNQVAKNEHRLADLVVRGALIDEPISVVDDELCSVVVDGWGVDRLGDPGFNIQVTNRSDAPIDLWVLEPFSVAGKAVKTYLCETIAPRSTEAALIQFDTAELGSANPRSLVDVAGVLLVDDDEGTTIAEYPFELAQVI